jgi:hypothetical protein
MVDSNTTAEVWVDGIDTGYTTPTLMMEVNAGEHTVELRDSNGVRATATKVLVRQGETKRLTLGASSTGKGP